MKRFLLLSIILTSIEANATGVCLVCPAGYDCSTGAPVLGGVEGQILVQGSTGIVWKNVSEVNLRGPQGAPGLTGASGPVGDKGATTTGPEGARGPQGVASCTAPANANTSNDNVNIQWGCTAGSGSSNAPTYPSASSGLYCWCRMQSKAQPGTFSSWVYYSDYVSDYYCDGGCNGVCLYYTSWRSKATW